MILLDAILGCGDKVGPDALREIRVAGQVTHTAFFASWLVWMTTAYDGDTIVWHDGQMGGFSSFVAFSLRDSTGVVVLSNTASVGGVQGIGLHILKPDLPLRDFSAGRQAIQLEASTVELYAGRYELEPGFTMTRYSPMRWMRIFQGCARNCQMLVPTLKFAVSDSRCFP